MVMIIVEGVLFVALVATVAALLLLVARATPVGRRVRQTRNRRRIDRAAVLRCPAHGPQREDDLVRLTTGERVCAECYKETLDGYLDR
ncbi:MAG TPA: hypothetical protein VKA84_07285 [Gemmatimonadaceae bacterium]|nr:hypothetical protein [Gemmatimonadaceae bacterium]